MISYSFNKLMINSNCVLHLHSLFYFLITPGFSFLFGTKSDEVTFFKMQNKYKINTKCQHSAGWIIYMKKMKRLISDTDKK